jgi:hypothetical protein
MRVSHVSKLECLKPTGCTVGLAVICDKLVNKMAAVELILAIVLLYS